MNKNNFELLLPVGEKDMAMAAIHHGADAIYVGFPGFNARGRSYDFELSELEYIIKTCHLYGLKVNLAFNIVVFENELEKVIEAIKQVLPLKPDALIVQDLGLIQIIKQLAPLQIVHASTQMTVTNDLAIKLVEDLKIKRFVLGRENSISEIKAIKNNTDKELEVFVHGALCVSYSGQCFTSETLGGRSANRGQCAQSCRFSYELYVDNELKDLVDRQFLVSPKDLCGLSEVSELMDAGVTSFKVEGRLKTPEYVATVASSFRKVIDAKLSSETFSENLISSEKNRMALQYSRGFFSGWLYGVNHQMLVDGTYSSHQGIHIGKIKDFDGHQIILELNDQNKSLKLENGDGLVWNESGHKIGSFIFSIDKINLNTFKIGLSNETKFSNLSKNAKVFLNHKKEIKKEIQKTFTDKSFFKKIPIAYKVIAHVDKPLEVVISDQKWTFSKKSESLLVPAQKKSLTKEVLFDELSSLGGSIFTVDADCVEFNLQPNLFLPLGELKKIRQALISELESIRSSTQVESFDTNQKINDYSLLKLTEETLNFSKFNKHSIENKIQTNLKFNVLLRTKEQVIDFLKSSSNNIEIKNWINSIILDFEFGRHYQESIDSIKSSGFKCGIATTRILKPQEYNNLKVINNLKPDVILVRNLGSLYYFNQIEKQTCDLIGDFSLNVTNSFSFNYLLNKGLKSICLSYDMNFEQVNSLINSAGGEYAEITIHQYMPSFHMEHCVFAAFLSKGSSFKDCGKPCEKHLVQLKDQFGHRHWIKPDQECRNTMYNAQAQTSISYIKDWKASGVKFFRYEALHESGHEVFEKIQFYVKYLTDQSNYKQAFQVLNAKESYGLSSGNLGRKEEYQSRKKDHSFLS